MGVFKNSVGRPTNKVIKTRRIAKLSIAFAVVAIVALTTGLLTTISTKKVKGKTPDYFYAKNLKVTVTGKDVFSSPACGDTLEKEYKCSASVEYYKNGEKIIDYNIKNKNKFIVYYKIIDNNTNSVLKTGLVPALIGNISDSFKVNLYENEIKNVSIKYYKSRSNMNKDNNLYSEFEMDFKPVSMGYGDGGIPSGFKISSKSLSTGLVKNTWDDIKNDQYLAKKQKKYNISLSLKQTHQKTMYYSYHTEEIENNYKTITSKSKCYKMTKSVLYTKVIPVSVKEVGSLEVRFYENKNDCEEDEYLNYLSDSYNRLNPNYDDYKVKTPYGYYFVDILHSPNYLDERDYISSSTGLSFVTTDNLNLYYYKDDILYKDGNYTYVSKINNESLKTYYYSFKMINNKTKEENIVTNCSPLKSKKEININQDVYMANAEDYNFITKVYKNKSICNSDVNFDAVLDNKNVLYEKNAHIYNYK